MDNKTITTIVALALTAFYLGLSVWMINAFGTNWDHIVVIYSGVTSIAFTAVGVLLGAKVQQVNLDKATQAADRVKDEVKQKTNAIHTALEHVNEAVKSGQDEAGGGAGSLTRAQSILQQALS